jgi:hypothetical protein
LPLDTRFSGSNPAKDNGFLMATKIRGTTSFRKEVKLAIQTCKISQHVKDPYSMKEIFVSKIHGHFSPSFFLL